MKNKISVMLFVTFLGFGIDFGEAWAIVGRPLTPVSVAGVARRTTRRTVGVAAVGVASVGVTAAAATSAAALTTLPPHCVSTVVGTAAYQNCSGQYYQPTYNGPNVVYVPVAAPPQG